MRARLVVVLWVPHWKRSRDELVRNPGSDCHPAKVVSSFSSQKNAQRKNIYLHGDTSILDLLETKALHVVALKSSFTFGETERIVSVVSGNSTVLLPLTVVGGRLEDSGADENLDPTTSWDHGDSFQRTGLGNVRESNSKRFGQEPVLGGFRVESVGTGGSEVQREVDTELLDPESDGSNHSNASVLDLSILEPLECRRSGILQEKGAKRWALVAKFNSNSKLSIKLGSTEGNTLLADGRRSKGGSSREEERKQGSGLHLSFIFVMICKIGKTPSVA